MKKHTSKCSLKRLRERRLITSKQKQRHPKYPINDLNAIMDLVHSQKGKYKFTYDFSFNQRRTKLPISIAPIALLGGRLGVYADATIKKSNKMIGCYVGKRSKRHPIKTSNVYVFEIQDKNDEPIEFLDAEHVRDWTAFINHSVTPNLYVDQRKINGKTNICFYMLRTIKKGEQLTYDYGPNYFITPKLKPFYIHTSDNWLSNEEVYLANQTYYAADLYSFDADTRHDLKLGESAQISYLLPAIFLPIYHHDVTALKKLLKHNYPIDLHAYSCKSRLLPPSAQQHMTALMFACYLGNEQIIQTLLEHAADVDRYMLVSGYSAFTALMFGHASQQTAEKIGAQLLKKMSFVTVTDEDKLSVLHYAIQRRSLVLTKLILQLFSKEDFDWLDMLQDRPRRLPPHADFNYCLQHGYMDILKELLSYAVKEFGTGKDSIIAAINDRVYFKKSVLAATPPAYVDALRKLLAGKKFKKIKRSELR